jgi:hypothetical protein
MTDNQQLSQLASGSSRSWHRRAGRALTFSELAKRLLAIFGDKNFENFKF